MAGHPGGGTLSKLAMSRVVEKPFIVTEYNHPFPNTYSSEAFLLLSAYAGLQDWDGIFSFEYSMSNVWDLKKIRGSFDIDQNPTKLVTLIPSFALFTRGDVNTSSDKKTICVTHNEILEAIGRYGSNIYANRFGMNPEMALKYPIGMTINQKTAVSYTDKSINNKMESITKELVWDETPNQGVVTVNTLMSKAVIGSTKRNTFVLGDVNVKFGQNIQDWAALTLTKFGDPGFESKGSILITATGYEQNSDMIWKDSSKSSVGNNWGEAPSLVEGIKANITLPVNPCKVKGWALDEKGNRKNRLEIQNENGKSIITIDKKYKTLWYELEIIK